MRLLGDGESRAAAVYVDTDTAEAYAEALVRLVDAPERRRSMGLVARHRAVHVLSWASQARRYTQLMRQLTAEAASTMSGSRRRRRAA